MKNGLKIYQKEISNKLTIKMNSDYNNIEKNIKSFGFNIISKDFNRPWGGFLVIDETQAQEFSNKFFEGLDGKI